MKRKNGITLIALVITIIVLLILAGVSISMISGEDGLLTNASNAKVKTAIATEKEQLSQAYSASQLDSASGSYLTLNVTPDQMQQAMDNAFGQIADVSGISKLIEVTFKKSNRKYLIVGNGAVVDYTQLLNEATEDVIGIAEDGSIVDMSLWTYTHISNGTVSEDYELTDGYILNTHDYSWINPGYIGDIVDGKIIGQVPMYIGERASGSYSTGDFEFKPVVNMYCAFYGLEDLEEAPTIPSTVECMDYTFGYCNNLTGNIVINSTPTKYFNCLCDTAVDSGSITLMGDCDKETLNAIAETAEDTVTVTIK